MPPAPVSLCLIVKNETRLVESLAPLRPYVKQIAVVDTGSCDDLRDGLKNLQATGLIDTLYLGEPGEFDYHGIPIDFSKARDKSFSLAGEPWIMWMDGDDLIEGIVGLEKTISELSSYRALNTLPIQACFPYEYAYEEHWAPDGTMTIGRCTFLVSRERIHENRGPSTWSWQSPVHETCVTTVGLPVQYHRSDLVWKHGRQRVGKAAITSLKRNWAIFKKWWEVEPDVTHRKALYTGMCLFEMLGDFPANEREAIAVEAEDFLAHAVKSATMDEDVVIAAAQMVKLLLCRNKFDKAIAYADVVMHAKEDWASGYCMVAHAYFKKAEASGWKDRRAMERSYAFGKIAIEKPSPQWFADSLERCVCMTEMVILCDQLVRFDEAFALCERALREFPGDGHATANYGLFKGTLDAGKARAMLTELRGMRDRGIAVGAINALARDLPALLPAAPAPVESPAVPSIEPLRADGRLRVVIATPLWMAPWDGRLVFTPEWKGGGSEVAVAELAKRLAALGHEVTVWANSSTDGEIDSARWQKTTPGSCDVFIAWRYADLLESDLASRAMLRVLWLHDVIAHQATDDRLRRADVVVTLSEYHKQVVLQNHPVLDGKLAIVRSGADATRFFDHTKPRNLRRVVHNSSPDRGAKHLVAAWPEIRSRVSDAELHLFYGFEMWELADPNNVERKELLYRIRSLEGSGVFLRQRVSADALAGELLTSGVWCYPCTWPEIFCVAAVEAQMAGLRIVSTPVGALSEVVRAGALLKPDMGSDEGREALVKTVVLALTEPEGGPLWPDRLALAQQAMGSFGLDPIGKLWEDLLKEKLLDKVDLPKYESEL
jgi:glycosyltransferase involved in cell wall biosynthesis